MQRDDGSPAELGESERDDVENRGAPRPVVVYEVIRKEGERELERSASALAFSGLAAGLSMGFSFLAQGLVRARLPAAPWQALVSSAGYSVGFLIVILGRQQLYTENTLTPILPLLRKPSWRRAWRVLRLWAIVLATNLLGTLAFASILAHLSVVHSLDKAALLDLGREALDGSIGTMFVHAIFAGWLIALMVWLLPGAASSRPAIIVIVTYVVGLAGFAHVIAGAVEVCYVAELGDARWLDVATRWFVPVLLGNVTGGLLLVTALNHAQVTSGENVGHGGH